MSEHKVMEAHKLDTVVPLTTSSQEALSWRLGSFRPSDREALLSAINDPSRRRSAMSAIQSYVIQWDESDWLEEYSIERIGKWVAKSAPAPFTEELMIWSSKRNRKASQAFAAGIRRFR